MSKESLSPYDSGVLEALRERLGAAQAERKQAAKEQARRSFRTQPALEPSETPAPRRDSLTDDEIQRLRPGQVVMINGRPMVARRQQVSAPVQPAHRRTAPPRPTLSPRSVHTEQPPSSVLEEEQPREHSRPRRRGVWVVGSLAVTAVISGGIWAFNSLQDTYDSGTVIESDATNVATAEQTTAGTITADQGEAEAPSAEVSAADIDYAQLSLMSLIDGWEEACISGPMGTFIRVPSTTDIVLQTPADGSSESQILNPFLIDTQHANQLRNPQVTSGVINFTACPEMSSAITVDANGLTVDLSEVTVRAVAGSGYDAPAIDSFTIEANDALDKETAAAINESFAAPELQQQIAGLHFQATVQQLPEACQSSFGDKLQKELSEQLQEQVATQINQTQGEAISATSIPIGFVGNINIEDSANYLVTEPKEPPAIISSLETNPIEETECSAIPHR